MRKNLAIVFCLSFIIVFFAGCESGEEISSVSIPENSETITIPVSQESSNSINVTDSNGKTIDVSSKYDSEQNLLVLSVPKLSAGQELSVNSGNDTIATLLVTEADLSPLKLLTSNVSNGAVGVEINLPIELKFNKAITGTSLSASSVSIVETKYNRSIPIRFIYDYDTITVIPRMKLQQDLNYVLSVNNLKDITGDVLSFQINYKNSDLDYGLYFFGKFGVCEKYFPGVNNAFYNNTRPTLIYAHGWQPDAVSQKDYYGRSYYGYEHFFWEEDNFGGQKSYNVLRQFTNHSWIDKGWNTGIVYWQQFADEPTMSQNNVGGVHDAEAKIWSFNGYKGSRYRVVDSTGKMFYKDWNRQVNFGNQVISAVSVGHLLSLYVNDALKNNVSGNFRLAGHSLGNQVVNNLAKYAYDAGIKVNRIALLDPAWTGGNKDYLQNDGFGKWVGERCRNYIFTIKNKYNDLAVEIYHTTGMNIGAAGVVVDPNDPLTNVVADINAAPWYYGNTQLDGKHKSIRHSYMWSFEYAAPIEVTISWWKRSATGKMGPSASTPDWRIREMMTKDYEWTQVEGRYTPSPSDDQYERKTKDTSWFSLM